MEGSEATDPIIEEQCKKTAKGSAEDAERGDVGFAVGETGGIVLPFGGVEVEIVLERWEADTGGETAFIVAFTASSVW